MFSTWLRAAVYVPLTVFVAAVLEWVLGQLIDAMQVSCDSIVANAFCLTQEHFLLLALIAIGTLVAARAVVESEMGGSI